MTTPTSVEFAEHVLSIDNDSLTDADRKQIKRLIFDWCGVVPKGMAMPWGEKLTKWAEQNGGNGGAVVAGSGLRRSAAVTALVNGTAAHGYELDDTHDDGMCHPAAVVITAALAVAGQIGAPSRDLFPAIAAGYQAMGRIGMSAKALSTIQFGFHPTATWGIYGAAAAAAKLMGLDGKQLANAWGLALSMTAGSLQFSEEPQGTMIKRMHAGLPAHNGILSAELSALGVAGPVKALEGTYGFFKLYGHDSDPSLLMGGDRKLEIHNISIKPYSCCRKFHSLIDAIQEVTGGKTLEAEQIEAIKVFQPVDAIAQHRQRRPDSVMAAQYSMPYIVGATLAYGPSRYDAYDEDHHKDPKILTIVDKVESVRDESLEADYPAHMSHGIEITLKGGKATKSYIKDSKGTPYNPLDVAGIREKAAGLYASVDPGLDAKAVEAAVWALDTASGDVTKLMDTLAMASKASAVHAAE